jgi:hypothetical protein
MLYSAGSGLEGSFGVGVASEVRVRMIRLGPTDQSPISDEFLDYTREPAGGLVADGFLR